MAFQHIVYDVRDGLAQIVLNRPERLNPLGGGPGGSRLEIENALSLAEQDETVACALIAANGPVFSAGGDLTGNPERKTALDNYQFLENSDRFYASVRQFKKPLIAAVNGLCLGAAMPLVCQCDFVIAADDARFGMVEGRLGLGGASYIVDAVGVSWAKFLIMTGELIDASRAEQLGLVLAVVPAADLRARTIDLAGRISRMPREGLLLNKACINAVAEASGTGSARGVRHAMESIVASMGMDACAPDGRRFKDILQTEGMPGLKAARELQFKGSWFD